MVATDWTDLTRKFPDRAACLSKDPSIRSCRWRNPLPTEPTPVSVGVVT